VKEQVLQVSMGLKGSFMHWDLKRGKIRNTMKKRYILFFSYGEFGF